MFNKCAAGIDRLRQQGRFAGSPDGMPEPDTWLNTDEMSPEGGKFGKYYVKMAGGGRRHSHDLDGVVVHRRGGAKAHNYFIKPSSTGAMGLDVLTS